MIYFNSVVGYETWRVDSLGDLENDVIGLRKMFTTKAELN